MQFLYHGNVDIEYFESTLILGVQNNMQHGPSPEDISSALYFLYDSTKYTVARGSPLLTLSTKLSLNLLSFSIDVPALSYLTSKLPN
jgi:hypothetical protein